MKLTSRLLFSCLTLGASQVMAQFIPLKVLNKLSTPIEFTLSSQRDIERELLPGKEFSIEVTPSSLPFIFKVKGQPTVFYYELNAEPYKSAIIRIEGSAKEPKIAPQTSYLKAIKNNIEQKDIKHTSNIPEQKQQQFELLNMLGKPIQYALGTASNPPTTKDLREVTLSQSGKTTVPSDQATQLLIQEKNKPENSYLYEFPKGKDVLVQLFPRGDGSELTPLTERGYPFWNNVKKDQIKLIKSFSAAPGAQPVDEARARAKLLAEEAEKERFTRRIVKPGQY